MGAPFSAVRRALLYHVGVAGFSTFIVDAAVAVTTRLESVERATSIRIIHEFRVWPGIAKLTLESSCRRHCRIVRRRRPHHLARMSDLVREERLWESIPKMKVRSYQKWVRLRVES